ncbi:MAG: AAA family ATPase, partial [Paludibacteraceae bacterium]|nr:AAA family ATPase [Paludibacteraceae bacterium]
MIITSVKIENFKSIDKIEIPFDKVGDSYTKIFVGINESGKSNILEALSFFDMPKQNVSYDQYCNQKLEDGKDCDLKFYMEFEEGEREALVKTIKSIVNTELELKIEIPRQICKFLYLRPGGTQFRMFYSYDIKLQNQDLFIKVPSYRGDVISIVDSNNKSDNYENLNKDNFLKYFGDIITDFIKRNEPSVSIWKPTNKDLLYSVNLMDYKKDIIANKPLYNIFKLSGYKDEKAISNIIDKVSIPKSRSKLKDKLTDSLNNYIAKVWENQIDFVIDITETGNFTLFIKDKGKENIYDRFSITDRSQGAQHFLSLILSLSLSANNHEKRNELIIIDEPETHLHPSGIRNLAQELLKIGHENYMFIATHSPFMIDKNHKERHCIVKKNSKAITELNWIKDSDNIIDDEVLRDAFGIDVYRDLLNPHSVLV